HRLKPTFCSSFAVHASALLQVFIGQFCIPDLVGIQSLAVDGNCRNLHQFTIQINISVCYHAHALKKGDENNMRQINLLSLTPQLLSIAQDAGKAIMAIYSNGGENVWMK